MSRQAIVVVKTAAPLRLDLAGGWTDVPPFSATEGGMVVNLALGLFAQVTVETGGEGILLVSEDLGQAVKLRSPAELTTDGKLPLLQAALRRFPVSPCSVRTRSEAPAGSGLGSSGALDVALVSALTTVREEPMDKAAIAHEAWEVEAVEAGMAGGKQDQYAAALGGCRLLRFRDPDVETDALELDASFLDHLERHFILCYTGTSRVSGDTIRRVMGAYEKGEPRVVNALHGIRSVAERMAEALGTGDPARVGALLSENWSHQRALDGQMQTPAMAKLESAMREAGVLGGKAAGAGAGGCMFFLAADHPERATRAAQAAGAQILPVSLAREGVRKC